MEWIMENKQWLFSGIGVFIYKLYYWVCSPHKAYPSEAKIGQQLYELSIWSRYKYKALR
jgi:hypothetical protein